MNPSFTAFSDELIKLAFYQRLKNGFLKALSNGWHGTGPVGSSTRNTWFGVGAQPAKSTVGKAWEGFTSLGGLTKALPVGAKSMMAIPAGIGAVHALTRRDPTGQERSSSERLVGLGGNTVGGLVGSSIGMRAGLPGMIAGGMIGSMVGEKVVTSPFRAARQHRMAGQAALQPQPLAPQQAPNPGVVQP